MENAVASCKDTKNLKKDSLIMKLFRIFALCIFMKMKTRSMKKDFFRASSCARVRTSSICRKSIFLFFTFFLAIGPFVQGQTLADYQFSTGHDASRWYTLDSTRNMLVLGSTRYYVRSEVEDIGFDFPFADSVYSQFSVTHDGNMRLGSIRAISSSNNQGSPFHPLRAGTNNPKINFMGCAGYTSDSAYVHRQLFGQAPNRVLVVEFALQTYSTSSRRSLLRWQVQLHENGDIQIVYPSQAPPILPTVQHQQGMCMDETDVLIVDQNHTMTHYTNGCSTYIPFGYWPDTNRYYSFEFPNDVCAMPTGAVAASIDTSSVTLAWNGNMDATEYIVNYSTSPVAAASGAGTQLSVSDTFTVIDNLSAGVLYHFYVRIVCSDGDTGNAAYIPARTLTVEPVSAFPYFCDFESADERGFWHMPVGNLSTRWWIDTAVNNTLQGNYSLYISQDSGATNTGGDQWIGAYAYRDMNLEEGDWTVSFDWRAYGDWSYNAGTTQYYHFLRAFLVPSSVDFIPQTPANFPLSPHPTAVPSGWIDLNPAAHVFVGQTSWTNHSAVVTVPASGCYHLVFYWETDGFDPPVDMPAAVDNISVEHISCPQPRMLTATSTEDEIMLSWHRGGNESLWLVRYGTEEAYVNNTFYLVTGLELNTQYSFEVYSICGGGDTSLATTGVFSTSLPLPVANFPYSCDFEDSLMCRQWVMPDDGQTNRWYTGTAVNNTPQGQHSLYVSQDGGVTNTYSASDYTISYAYRAMTLDTVQYVCSFDWRCLGDDDFHFMRAFIVPLAAIPSSGSFPVYNNHYSGVPAGWIDLNPQSHYMSGQSNWTTLTQTFRVSSVGEYALLFMWENDEYTPQNPPAAVDNITIDIVSCPIPSGLAANAAHTMVDLTWDMGTDAQIWLVEYADTMLMTYQPYYTATGLTPNTEYQFSVSTLCYTGDTSIAATLTVRTSCMPITTLPYICDFGEYSVGTGNNDGFIPCWNRILNYNTFSPQVSSISGNNCLYWNLTAGMLDNATVVLPELDENIYTTYTELRFKAMKYDLTGMLEDPVFVVGVMDDPDNMSTFAALDTVTVTNTSNYEDYSVQMLAYGGTGRYVAICGIVSGSNFASAMCYMDDIELHELPYCHRPRSISLDAGIDTISVAWIPGNDETEWMLAYGDTVLTTLQPNYVARGLVSDREYIFSVAAICGEGDTSVALSGRVRTLPDEQDPPDTVECQEVTNAHLYQDPTWEYYLYFYWSGTADAYELKIGNFNSGSENVYLVTDTTYFFDAHGRSDIWYFIVRSVCGDGHYSEWSDSLIFFTPLCIGLYTPENSDGITLYPNPSQGYATLSLNGLTGEADVSVVDITGRVVRKKQVDCNGGNKQIAIEDLAPGTYFVRISAQGLNAVRRLVVK